MSAEHAAPFGSAGFSAHDGDHNGGDGGARAADVVVRMFSGYCVAVIRQCDSFGRLVPARFLALLPETDGSGAFMLASRMCRDLAALAAMVSGQPVNFAVSIGVTEMDGADRWAGDMLRRAEQGLEDATERGRGIAILATPPALPPHVDDDAFQLTDDTWGKDLA